MAFFDWNHNGEMDFADDFLEYNIFCECMKTEEEAEALTEIWADEDEDEDEEG